MGTSDRCRLIRLTVYSKIAAFSKWKFPHMMDALQKPTEMMKDPLPVGYNEKLLQGFVDRLAASREQHWDGNTDYSE